MVRTSFGIYLPEKVNSIYSHMSGILINDYFIKNDQYLLRYFLKLVVSLGRISFLFKPRNIIPPLYKISFTKPSCLRLKVLIKYLVFVMMGLIWFILTNVFLFSAKHLRKRFKIKINRLIKIVWYVTSYYFVPLSLLKT